MSSLKVDSPGAKYCHFPINSTLGYDQNYFTGLLSERSVLRRVGGRDVWKWEMIPGHKRNEALDCRNYAMAAFSILNPDMDAEERKVKGLNETKKVPSTVIPKKRRQNSHLSNSDW
jgi:phage terminase large subunit GpA-like protein